MENMEQCKKDMYSHYNSDNLVSIVCITVLKSNNQLRSMNTLRNSDNYCIPVGTQGKNHYYPRKTH
jgi:hypothetical protein